MQKNKKKGNLSNLPLEEEEENVPNGNWKEREREENKGPFSYMLTGSRRTGGGPRILNRGGGGFGAQPGGLWDTHRGAPKIFEGGGQKISSGRRRRPNFCFYAGKNVKKVVFLYISGEHFIKKFSGRLRRLVL